MEELWEVILYRSPNGNFPVQDFIIGLEHRTQAKIRNAIKLLGAFGISLGYPHVKKLTGADLWELRILGGDSIRVLYVAVTGKKFVLLHGFRKKRQETPPKEIKIAKDRLAEYRLRTRN